MNKKNNRKGFTIVELVIVIAVIAILATVLVPVFGNVIENANENAALQAARNELTTYMIDHAQEGNDDFVIKGDDTRYFAVVNGQLKDTAYASVEAALAAFDTEANAVTAGTAVGNVTPVTVVAKTTT